MSMDKNHISGVLISDKGSITLEIENLTERNKYYYYFGKVGQPHIQEIYNPKTKKSFIKVSALDIVKPQSFTPTYAYILKEIKDCKNPDYLVLKFEQPRKSNELQFCAVKKYDSKGDSSVILEKGGFYLVFRIIRDNRLKKEEKKEEPYIEPNIEDLIDLGDHSNDYDDMPF